jgi:hypothetical protein
MKFHHIEKTSWEEEEEERFIVFTQNLKPHYIGVNIVILTNLCKSFPQINP